MTSLPLIKLMRCRRSVARWQLPPAWPKGANRAGAASIYFKVDLHVSTVTSPSCIKTLSTVAGVQTIRIVRYIKAAMMQHQDEGCHA